MAMGAPPAPCAIGEARSVREERGQHCACKACLALALLLAALAADLSSEWIGPIALLLFPGQTNSCWANARSRGPAADSNAWPASLRTPDERCPMYLEPRQKSGGSVMQHYVAPLIAALHLEESGIGHSFMVFNSAVSLAATLNLSLRANFTTRGHGLDSSDVQRFYFGNSFSAPLPSGDAAVEYVLTSPGGICEGGKVSAHAFSHLASTDHC